MKANQVEMFEDIEFGWKENELIIIPPFPGPSSHTWRSS